MNNSPSPSLFERAGKEKKIIQKEKNYMAQNENYSQVDLRVGTEEQFNAKVGTLPAGTLFGVTDSTVSKADLSTDLKNEINGKINKPANPTSDSAVVINSSGTVSTKPLTSITGKSEVYVGTPDPTGGEILWIDPDGTSSGDGSSGGGVQFVELFQGSTLTPAQLTILKANKGNQIIYYGGVLYYFKLAYEKSSNEWIYVTFYGGAATLTVNMTTGSAIYDTASSGKPYSHLIQGNYSFSGTNYNFIFTLYSTISTKMTNEQIYNLTNTCKVLCWTRTSTSGSSSQTDYCTHLLQTGPSPSWGINQPNNFGYIELKSSTYTDTVTEL